MTSIRSVVLYDAFIDVLFLCVEYDALEWMYILL